MFDTLDDRIRQDDDATISRRERRIRNTIVILVSALLFGTLYAALRYAEA